MQTRKYDHNGRNMTASTTSRGLLQSTGDTLSAGYHTGGIVQGTSNAGYGLRDDEIAAPLSVRQYIGGDPRFDEPAARYMDGRVESVDVISRANAMPCRSMPDDSDGANARDTFNADVDRHNANVDAFNARVDRWSRHMIWLGIAFGLTCWAIGHFIR